MLSAHCVGEDERLALRQQLAVACTPPRSVAGRSPVRVVRLDGERGRVWYTTPESYTAADAELTLRGVTAAVIALARRRHQRSAAAPGERPEWIVTFLWRLATGAARCLRQLSGCATRWQHLDRTRHALLASCEFGATHHAPRVPPRTRWVSWHAAEVSQWMHETACPLRLRDLRVAAQADHVWTWDPRVVRALPNAIVSDPSAHQGDVLVEATDLLLWMASMHAPTAVAVAARAARLHLNLRRGIDAQRWCAAQHAAGEPWARVGRVAGAALCGRLPILATLLPTQ